MNLDVPLSNSKCTKPRIPILRLHQAQQIPDRDHPSVSHFLLSGKTSVSDAQEVGHYSERVIRAQKRCEMRRTWRRGREEEKRKKLALSSLKDRQRLFSKKSNAFGRTRHRLLLLSASAEYHQTQMTSQAGLSLRWIDQSIERSSPSFYTTRNNIR